MTRTITTGCWNPFRFWEVDVQKVTLIRKKNAGLRDFYVTSTIKPELKFLTLLNWHVDINTFKWRLLYQIICRFINKRKQRKCKQTLMKKRHTFLIYSNDYCRRLLDTRFYFDIIYIDDATSSGNQCRFNATMASNLIIFSLLSYFICSWNVYSVDGLSLEDRLQQLTDNYVTNHFLFISNCY